MCVCARSRVDVYVSDDLQERGERENGTVKATFDIFFNVSIIFFILILPKLNLGEHNLNSLYDLRFHTVR